MPTPTGISRRRRRGDTGFSPLNLFAASEVGLWYDPSDLTPEKLAWVAANPGFTDAQFLAAFPTHSLFQNADGTPVTALGQSVGFVLDRRLGPSGVGAQVITNGTFGADSDWTKGTGWSIGSGVATKSAGTASLLSQPVTVVEGQRYILRYVLTRSAGSITPQLSGGSTVSGTARSAAGTYIEILTAVAGNTTFEFSADASFAGTVDNVTLLAIPAGNHAWQATSTARPTLQARANLLTYSEQFENAAWTKSASTASANTVTAPDGTQTADSIVEDSTNASHNVNQSLTKTASAITYTLSAYVKGNGRNVLLRFDGGSGVNRVDASFDLSSGTVSVAAAAAGTFTSPSASIQSAGNGWYRCIVTGTTGTETTVRVTAFLLDGTTSSYTGNSTSGVYLWGADLRLGTSAGTYQRVTTATDYADVGLPRSLTFDGTDDSLVTPSVDFTATDKMTVCAGVFKQSDAAGGMLVNHEASIGGVPAFFVTAPEGAAATYGGRTSGNSGAVLTVKTPANFAAPRTDVLSVLADNAATGVASFNARVNTVSQAMEIVGGTTPGAGNYGTTAIHVGQRSNSTLRFNGRIHQLIVRGAATDTATIQQTERFVAQKTGVTL